MLSVFLELNGCDWDQECPGHRWLFVQKCHDRDVSSRILELSRVGGGLLIELPPNLVSQPVLAGDSKKSADGPEF